MRHQQRLARSDNQSLVYRDTGSHSSRNADPSERFEVPDSRPSLPVVPDNSSHNADPSKRFEVPDSRPFVVSAVPEPARQPWRARVAAEVGR